MPASDFASRAAFIRASTHLKAPPLVPEIRLYQANRVMELWYDTEVFAAALACEVPDLPPPYWAFAWPGGQALARYVLDHPDEVANRSVLDFGAGSGLVAIAAAKAGGVPVVAADTDPLALAAIELNAALNEVFVEPVANDLIGADGRWRTVLAGDMCYERPLAMRLTAWLRNLAASGARVLLGDPGRAYFPADGVTRLATYDVPTSVELEDREMRQATVYAFSPSR